jgi:signal transduction histidine kinase/DNA-binding response OmpR family regulator
MKKALIIALIGISLLIASNFYYYRNTYHQQIDYQYKMLKKEMLVCNTEIDQSFKKTQTNILLLLNDHELEDFFKNPGKEDDTRKRLELLYNRYNDFLKELKIYNQNKGCYKLRKGLNGTHISSFEDLEINDTFVPKLEIIPDKNEIVYTQPLANEASIYGYITFVFDMKAFFQSIFGRFNVEEYQFQWIASQNGDIIYTTTEQASLAKNQDTRRLLSGKKPWFTHTMNVNGTPTEVLSVAEPLSLYNADYTVVFSLPTHFITTSIARNSFLVGVISIFIIVTIAVLFGLYLRRSIHAENHMKKNIEALRKMIYYLPAGIVMIDNKNRITQVNRAFLKLFDFEDEDLLVGHPVSEKLIFSNSKMHDKVKYSDYSYKYIMRTADDTETLVLNEKIPFFLKENRYLVDVYTEIPVFENSGSLPEKLTAQAAFITNISHELRTPLNGIIGMTDLLTHSQLPNAEAEMLGILKRSADTLLSLINDILDFSKIESGKFNIESIPFNLKSELEDTIQAFVPQAREKHINLTWHIPFSLPDDFVGDPMRFRQVMNNLLSNALKFTHKGKVHLMVTRTRLLNGNPALMFSIKDTGIGIPKEKQRLIFNSFYQADETTTRRFGGTGLGTTISKELVNLMGGDIWVNSPSDLSTDPDFPGSEFSFTLPLRTRRLIKTINTKDIKEYSQIKAVVITDDALQVQVITRNLKALKIDFKIMSNSQETIDLLRTSNKYHLIIVDNRTDFDGTDFLQTLFNHQLHKNFIILFQSSDNQKANTMLMKRLGADSYLRKPVRLIVLRDLLLQHFPSIIEKAPVIPNDWPETLKILVAEDNKLNQRVAQNLFNKIGFDIELANNGLEAIQKVTETQYDIVFMDIFMPELDGISAVRELKRLGITTPIVAMTASNDQAEQDRAFDAGMDDYICKPAKADDLLRMLTKWCAK